MRSVFLGMLLCATSSSIGLRLSDHTSGSMDPSIVCLVGDAHVGVTDFSARFNALAKRIPNMNCTAVVLMGDLTEHGSTKELKIARNMLSASNIDAKLIFATPGNHDLQKNVKDGWANPQLHMLDDFITIMGEDHHTLELPQTTIVITDSELLVSRNVELENRRQTLWAKLEQSLRTASEKNRTIVLVCHRPLFLRSRDEADHSQNWPLKERNRLISMLPSGTTTHVYAGHIHKSISITALDPTIQVNTITGSGPNDDQSQPNNFARVIVEHNGMVRTEFTPIEPLDSKNGNHQLLQRDIIRTQTTSIDPASAQQIKTVARYAVGRDKSADTGGSGDGKVDGYYKLSLPGLELAGQRDPLARHGLLASGLDLQGKTVLDVGTNIGAMLFASPSQIKWGVGVDFDALNINVANLIRNTYDMKHLSFYNFDLQKHNLDILLSLLPGQPCASGSDCVDVAFMFAVNMWISNWRDVINFLSRASKHLVLELNYGTEGPEEYLQFVKKQCGSVVIVEDPEHVCKDCRGGWGDRILLHCYKGAAADIDQLSS